MTNPRQETADMIKAFQVAGWVSATGFDKGNAVIFAHPKLTGTVMVSACSGMLAGMVEVATDGIIIVCDRARLAAAFAHVAAWMGVQ